MATINTANTTSSVFLKTAFLKTVLFRLFLLIGIAALPSFAFAVDTDGDGVDNSVDAFPNNIEASVDTDGDGKPNSFVRGVSSSSLFESFEYGLNSADWEFDHVSLSFGTAYTIISGSKTLHADGWTGTISKTMTFSQPTHVSWLWKPAGNGSSVPNSGSFINGAAGAACVEIEVTGNVWKCTKDVQAGTYTFSWQLNIYQLGMGFSTYDFLDDILISQLVEDLDDDNDGVADAGDAFPLGNTQAGDIDTDGIDGFVDNCPANTNADQLNTDGDSQGNVCDSDDDNDSVVDTSDKFPLNAAASSDTDVDGFPGSWNGACDATCQANSGLVLDNCPSNANADQLNTDGDTQGNVCDADDDNDGLFDTGDAFPLDNTQAGDVDADGIDGFVDNCPSNANADQLNTDGDAQGNACDTDDDNDSVADTSDKFPLNAAASVDGDLDGVPTNWNAACNATCQANSGLLLDNCPSNTNADQLNTDGDTQGDVCDSDDDNDGVADVSDAFPLNAAETLDTDLDGTGNNADTDDDNDGLPDAMDPLPLQAKFNRDANYKGSQIQDGASIP